MRSRMMALSLGIISVCWFPFLPERLWLYASLLLLAPCVLLRRAWICNLLLLFLGICWGVEYGYRVLERQLPSALEGELFDVEGEVIGLPRMSGHFQRFRLDVDRIVCVHAENCDLRVNRLQLNWYQTAVLVVPGERWRLRVKLKRPHGMANPGGFDYQTWMVQQGIAAVGYVREQADNQLLVQNRWSTAYWRWRLCRFLDPPLDKLAFGGILKALLTGDKQGVSQSQWQLFADTNTTHLMVISGLHIGLVAGLGFWLGRLLALLTLGRIAPDQLAAVVGFLAALFYSVAAGFSLPTQRALVMVAVVMGSIFLRRQLSVGYGLLLALLLCLLLDPLAPASLSFWLSFAAVSVIVYGLCGTVVQAKWWQGLRVQWLAFIGLAPVLALFFGQLSVLSPFANTVLVPVFSLFIVPLNFLSMLLLVALPEWAGSLFTLVDRVLGWQLDYLNWLKGLAFPSLLKVPAVHSLDMLLACVGVLIVFLPRAMPLRSCGFVLMAPLLMTRPAVINEGDIVLTVLDVGQGLSVVVQTAGHVLVYDIGPAYSDSFSTGSAVVAPHLNHRGVERVDMLVLSHSDNDHSGSWPGFLERVDVTAIVYGEALAPSPNGNNTRPCRAGESWVWDGVTFSFLHPAANRDHAWSANNMSCVLKVSAGKTSVLLTGDIERQVESKLLLLMPELLAADILLAPHHGSKTSSSWPFIRAVNPNHIVFTSGYRNRFGHPHRDIVKRYEHQGSEMYNSAGDGAIIFTVKQGQIASVQRYRSQLNRYWL